MMGLLGDSKKTISIILSNGSRHKKNAVSDPSSALLDVANNILASIHGGNKASFMEGLKAFIEIMENEKENNEEHNSYH